jgi:hypothetical protein
MENKITLVQSPVIKHKLQEAGKLVTQRIEELELDKQVATVDNVKSMKDLRAELNKELADFESQRKTIKEGVNKPYLEFEDIYKTEISDKYKSATDTLKDKIASVEDKIKRDKKESVELYFNELCQSEKIDFIAFEKLGIEFNLSTTEKKYKETVNDYIMKVVDALALIKSTDYEAEILTEYKTSLNVSNAITSVKTRKEAEQQTAARLKAELTQSRKNYLLSLGLNFVEITNSYEYNADIYVSLNDIENLSKEEYITKISEIEVKIKNDIASKQVAVDVSETPLQETPITSPPKIVVSAPISAPTVQTPAKEIKVAQFEVKATMSKLRALGEYMKSNGIEYKNI